MTELTQGIVRTRHGRVRGMDEGGTWAFLGIPYARPPRGSLRFRSPLAPEPWDGVLSAVECGPIAPQPEPGIGMTVPGDPVAYDEDCLSLNVWTGGPGDSVRRPVLVFIHGGGFVGGSGASQLYRGDRLSRRGDVVVVTINYRLGALGFLSHRALGDEGAGACGNWGVLDQIAALSWVRDNIAFFGGDPRAVTVFGESAGAVSVCALLGAPGARGLFRRAIVQSGPAMAIDLGEASAVCDLVAGELGLAAVTRAAFEQVPVDELLGAQGRVVEQFDSGSGLPFQPVVDGAVLRSHPAEAISSGAAAGVDLMIGTNRDEFKFFTFALPSLANMDQERLERRVSRSMRAAGVEDRIPASEVIDAYRGALGARGMPVTPSELFTAMASDWVFRVPSARMAEAQSKVNTRTFCYLFEWESPFLGGALGACHALELPFVFGTLDVPVIAAFSGQGPDADNLSAEMQDCWIAFARTGDPSARSVGPWPPYEPARRTTMVFGPASRVVDAPLEVERAFWVPYLGRFGIGGPIEGATPNLAIGQPDPAEAAGGDVAQRQRQGA